MKPQITNVEITNIEETIVLKKDNTPKDTTNTFNLRYSIFKSFKTTLFSILSISFISLFFLSNNISFEKQINFINTKEFSGSLCILLGLFMMVYIFNEIISSAKNGETLDKHFSSMWIPIKVSILSSLFIPFNGQTSVVSQLMTDIIHLLAKFF